MAKKTVTTEINPLHDYVLVKPLEADKKTASGIILPDSVKEKPQIGEIMAVGEGALNPEGSKKLPMIVKVGQKVMYKKWGGDEVKVNGEDWMLVRQTDLLAIVS